MTYKDKIKFYLKKLINKKLNFNLKIIHNLTNKINLINKINLTNKINFNKINFNKINNNVNYFIKKEPEKESKAPMDRK